MAETTQEDDGAQQHQQRPNEDNIFFKLPPELRNRIYEFALLKCGQISLVCNKACCRDQRRRAMQPALSRTCRVLRKETLPIFYGRHTFFVVFFSNAPAAETWLYAIGAENWRLLRDICISLHAWEGRASLVEQGSAHAGPMEKALVISGEKTLGDLKYYRLAVGGVEEEG